MGILKNILNNLMNTVKDEVIQPNRPASSPQPTPRPAPKPAPKPEPEEVHRTDAEWHQYFKEILATEFQEYTVKENVPVQDLAGNANDEFQLYSTRPRQAYKAEWGQPYTFLLLKEGTPKGVVMLGSGHSHDSNVKYLIARMYAKKLGLPYINFYLQMPNERAYVIQRINSFLHL